MKVSRIRGGMLSLLCVAALAVPAIGEYYHCVWLVDCPAGLTCVFDICWCEGEWDDTGNWGGPDCSEGPGPNKSVLIQGHQNTGCTGTPCVSDGSESWLQINLDNHSVPSMKVQARQYVQQLRVVFSGGTLTNTYSYIKFDGSNGPVTVEVIQGALVQTN